ncbi:MAG: hypothetical protein H6711_09955 [Myxococcales bacterium]|nr:hypothetical protein [Myxococcales bacterium]
MTYRHPLLATLLSTLLTLPLAACAGDDSAGESESDATSDSTGSTSTTGGSTSTSTSGSTTDETTGGSTSGGGSGYAGAVYPIFSANCSCHVAGSPGNLSLKDSLTAYAALVGVPSSQNGAMDRVAAGDAANSYLIHKLDGTHLDVGGSGVQMPQGVAPLSTADMTTITDWIEGGAPND